MNMNDISKQVQARALCALFVTPLKPILCLLLYLAKSNNGSPRFDGSEAGGVHEP